MKRVVVVVVTGDAEQRNAGLVEAPLIVGRLVGRRLVAKAVPRPQDRRANAFDERGVVRDRIRGVTALARSIGSPGDIQSRGSKSEIDETTMSRSDARSCVPRSHAVGRLQSTQLLGGSRR
ncbi:MAG TPA: hypothetical protein VM261_01390 [Kofleriaceae bacterium]|nr:hypothetical protein [Kofleriaceae bacterium]